MRPVGVFQGFAIILDLLPWTLEAHAALLRLVSVLFLSFAVSLVVKSHDCTLELTLVTWLQVRTWNTKCCCAAGLDPQYRSGVSYNRARIVLKIQTAQNNSFEAAFKGSHVVVIVFDCRLKTACKWFSPKPIVHAAPSITFFSNHVV